jgi:TM2 domain-containing membrane protein YozV
MERPPPRATPPALLGPGVPGYEEASSRSYGRAVVLSAVFGFAGVHLFYLRRPLEGMVDLGLTLGWLYAFAVDRPLLGVLLLVLDLGHAFAVTILLLTGNFRDGSGRRVAYPGQRIAGRSVT